MDNAKSENPNFNVSDSEYSSHIQHTHRRKNRRSVGSINDWSDEEIQGHGEEEILNTGNLTRKQLKAMPQLKHDISYGQYLHMPKSQRAIFTSQATKHRNKLIIRTVVVIALIVVIYLLIKSFY